jgi:hypothetical protein
MDDRPKGTSTRLALTLIVALVVVVVMIWMFRDIGSGDVPSDEGLSEPVGVDPGRAVE